MGRRIQDKEFFMKNVKNLFLIGLAVLAISLAGCPTDGDDSSSPSPSTGLDLPAINEQTTGRDEIRVSNAVLKGSAAGVSLAKNDSAEGYSFSVADGKLSFSLSTPSNPVVGKDDDYINRNLVGGQGWGTWDTQDAGFMGTFVPDDAKFSIPSFYDTVDGQDYYLWRFKEDTDKTTYYISSTINYVYVDKDCTITRDEKNWIGTDEDGETWPFRYNAVNLSLKKGWNLVQIDNNTTRELGTYTVVKIASQDVPWYIRTYK
jgi:hypothetical protein